VNPSRSNRGIRLTAILAMIGAAAIGLLSRTTPLQGIPVFTAAAGDTGWAIAAWFLFRMMFPQAGLGLMIILTAGLCLSVELSQLIKAQWLEDLRQHRIVALLIGRGFLWVDLVRYLAGIMIALLLDVALCAPARSATGRSSPPTSP
jgi:hypothetical protein